MLEIVIILQCLFVAFLLGVLSRILQEAGWHGADYVVFLVWIGSFFPAGFTLPTIQEWIGGADKDSAIIVVFLLIIALSYCALRLGDILTIRVMRRELIHRILSR